MADAKKLVGGLGKIKEQLLAPSNKVTAAERAEAGRKAAALIKSQPQVKASEALGQLMEKGYKKTTTTQADRTRVGGGNIGGAPFSAISEADPNYAEKVWGVFNEGTANRLINLTSPDTAWTTMLGTEHQLKTNPIVFDKLRRGFVDSMKQGNLSDELAGKINHNLALTFGEGADIRDPKIWKQADTFEKRAALSNIMMGKGIPPSEGGVSLGGEKSGRGVIFRPSDILKRETEPYLLHTEHGGDVPTFAAGPRLFRLDKETEFRPDLHPGFPTLIKGKDLEYNMAPVPTEIYLPDWHAKFKKDNPNRKPPSYFDLALGVKGEGLPSQDLNDEYIRHLLREGNKDGGVVDIDAADARLAEAIEKRMAKGGSVDIEAADARLEAAINARMGMADGGKLVKGLGKIGKKLLANEAPPTPKNVSAGDYVNGMMVRKEIPNQSSISASLYDYSTHGVQEVPMSAFETVGKPKYRNAQEESYTKDLARQIKENQELNPLIVVKDAKGHYILEGAHRFDALRELGIDSFPALMVHDLESLADVAVPAITKAEGGATEFKKLEFMADGGIPHMADAGKVVKGASNLMKKLFADSKVLPQAEREANLQKFLAPSAEKRRMYHGTKDPNITEFRTRKDMADEAGFSDHYADERDAVFLSPDPDFTKNFSIMGYTDEGMAPTTYPVYAQIKRPFDFDNPEHLKKVKATYLDMFHNPESEFYDPHMLGSERSMEILTFDKRVDDLPTDENNWMRIENPKFQDVLKDLGFDSFYTRERGTKNLGIYDPNRIKSATGNQGTYDLGEFDINKADGGKIVGGLGKIAKKLMADNVPTAKELMKSGQSVSSHTDAIGRLGNGERLFAYHEMSGKPIPITSVDDLKNWTPDQLLSLPTVQSQAGFQNLDPNFQKFEANLQKFLELSKTPMRLYHGTRATEGGKGNEAIRRIKPSKEGALGSGVYMTPQPASASSYALDHMTPDSYAKSMGSDFESANVLPVHAQIRNPLILGDTGERIDPAAEALMKLGMDKEKAQSLVERLYEEKGNIGKQIQSRAQSQGYDGLMLYHTDGSLGEVVSYNPNAVKSATGNQGTYDIYNPDLSKSDGGKIVKGLSKVAKKLLEEPRIQTIEAPSIIIPSKLSNVKEAVRKREGDYGARRVERAADEVPNLEQMYQEEALRQAFGGDNAKAMMTINPKDFEKYAMPIPMDIAKNKMYFTDIDKNRKPNMREVFRDSNLTDSEWMALDNREKALLTHQYMRKYNQEEMSHDQYLKHLAGIDDGFDDVPFLEINKQEQGLPLMPFISGHEGRHRNRALAGRGEEKSLVQLLPRAELREPFPRRSQEEYLEALKKEMEMTGNMVRPEAEEIYGGGQIQQIMRKPIELPDLYADGGAAFKTLQFKDAQHFDGGGIAFPEMTPMTEGSRREPLLTEKDWENIKRNAPEVYEWAKQNVKDEASQLKSARGVKDFALRTGAQYLGGIPDLLNLGLMGVDALADTNLSSEKPYFGSERYIEALKKYGAVGENEFPIAETVAGVLMPAGLIKKGIKKISGAKPAKQEPKKRQGGLSAMAR